MANNTRPTTVKRIELGILSAQTKLAMYGEAGQPIPPEKCIELSAGLLAAYDDFKALVGELRSAVE